MTTDEATVISLQAMTQDRETVSQSVSPIISLQAMTQDSHTDILTTLLLAHNDQSYALPPPLPHFHIAGPNTMRKNDAVVSGS